MAEFPLVAQTCFCDSRSPLCSLLHDLPVPLQPIFFHTAHRYASADQIFGPFRSHSALMFQAVTEKVDRLLDIGIRIPVDNLFSDIG